MNCIICNKEIGHTEYEEYDGCCSSFCESQLEIKDGSSNPDEKEEELHELIPNVDFNKEPTKDDIDRVNKLLDLDKDTDDDEPLQEDIIYP